VKFHQPVQTPDTAPVAPEATEAVKNHHGFSVGDLVYYKMGQGLGWKQVKIEAFSFDQAVIRINEPFNYNGKPMMGVAAKKPLDTLRAKIPQPLERNDFINLRTGFTKEYLESVKDRIEETRDAKVIADLIFKAKKFLGDDYQVPGILQVPADPEMDEPSADDQEMDAPMDHKEVEPPGAYAPEEMTPPVDGGKVLLCDLADQTALKNIKGMIEERGMDRAGVKLAMRGFVLHSKGEAPVRPFDTEEIGHIENRYAKHFGAMLDSLRPAHEVALTINHYGNRINGFGEYVKSKLRLFPTPIEVDHWYLLSPGAINKIKLNIDEWAKELLQFSEQSQDKF
jgi:hypothetical protein